jgi:hypothetical protein
MSLIHPNAPHGTRNGYTNYGCRCDECKKAHKEAVAARMAIRLAERVEIEEKSE